MQKYWWVLYFDFVEWEQTDGSLKVSFSGSDTATPQVFEEALFFILFLPDFMAFRLCNIQMRYSWFRHGWSFRRRISGIGRLSEGGSLTGGTLDTGGISEGEFSLGRTSDFGGISKWIPSTDVTSGTGRLVEGGSSLGRKSDIGGVSKEGLKILDNVVLCYISNCSEQLWCNVGE